MQCADQDAKFMKTVITGDESLDLRVRHGNKSPIITMENSGISEAKNGTPSSEQGKSDVDSFL
jgi:hypothetical protein